MKITRQR